MPGHKPLGARSSRMVFSKIDSGPLEKRNRPTRMQCKAPRPFLLQGLQAISANTAAARLEMRSHVWMSWRWPIVIKAYNRTFPSPFTLRSCPTRRACWQASRCCPRRPWTSPRSDHDDLLEATPDLEHLEQPYAPSRPSCDQYFPAERCAKSTSSEAKPASSKDFMN
jgi:hypothetical protein